VRLGPEGLDRINVQNNPVNLIDPHGLLVGSITFKFLQATVGRAVGYTAEGAYVAGKVADSALGIGASANVLPGGLSEGVAGSALQMVGGAQTFGLGTFIAGASSSAALPVALAGLAGVEIGLGFNSLYEYISGQPLGADIYDWLHPDDSCP
jgi:hypothetical protein